MCVYISCLLLARYKLVRRPTCCQQVSGSSPDAQDFAALNPVSPALCNVVCVPAVAQ